MKIGKYSNSEICLDSIARHAQSTHKAYHKLLDPQTLPLSLLLNVTLIFTVK